MASDDFPYGQNARGTAASSLGLDDWLHDSAGGGDDEGGILSWKKNKDDQHGELLGWLHTTAPILKVWRHGWFKVKEVEDRETHQKRIEVFSDRFVCHESDALLKSRKWRFSSRQDRVYAPPVDCPFDKMLEMLFLAVQHGEISWLEPVFEFKGSGLGRKTSDVLLHAAGMYGGFGEKNMPPQRVAELQRQKIRRDEAWREDVRAKVAYLLALVDNEKPEQGVRLAIEGEAFKRAFSKAIDDERKRMRKPDDSPVGPKARPYPFLFTYDGSQNFDARYSATAMADDLSTAVKERICDPEQVPNTDEYTTKGDPEALLASIEEHALVKLDWGSCFGDGKTRVQVPAKAPVGGNKPAPAPAAGEDDGHLYSCEHCGKATMTSTDYTCGGCGAVYVDGGTEDAPTVEIAQRPCMKCGTLIALPDASPENVGDKCESVICPKCATVHYEERVIRTERPCENTECKAMVALTAGATCGTCGRQHEFGETAPEDALAEVNAWRMVTPVVEEAPKKAPARGRAAARAKAQA